MERMRMEIESRSENEEFARVVAAVFMSRLDPTLEEVEDVKTAVSEAVTNAVIHGYRNGEGIITMELAAEVKGENGEDGERGENEENRESREDGESGEDGKSGENREYGERPAKSRLTVIVKDSGVGIPDVKKAMEPMYTSDPSGERSGMGFSFMEAFMDQVQVESEEGRGTCVTMKKDIGR